MKKLLIVMPLVALLLTACYVGPSRYGPGMVVAPALPGVVELGADPYYYNGGFYYYYNNNRWSYSNSRSGPWRDLPRDRYPREIRRRDGGDHGDRGYRR